MWYTLRAMPKSRLTRKQQKQARSRTPLLRGVPDPGMARVLEEFATPLLSRMPQPMSSRDMETILLLASVIWNSTLTTGPDQDLRAAVEAQLSPTMDDDTRAGVLSLVEPMERRKHNLFREHTRYIVSVEVRPSPGGPEVRVLCVGPDQGS